MNQALTFDFLQAYRLPLLASELVYHQALVRVLEKAQILHKIPAFRYGILSQEVAREEEERARHSGDHGHPGDEIGHERTEARDEGVGR